MRRYALLCLAIGCIAMARADVSEEIYRIGPGVTPPKIIKKAEPTYTDEARDALVQGTAVFEIVIGKDGKATDIRVLSPIGFGLDERAEDAIRQWEFKPGEKDGKPVRIRANVQVNFRFPELWYDAKAERRRTSFNVALGRLQKDDRDVVEAARKTIVDLAKDKFPAAMYLLSKWLREGTVMPADRNEAMKLLSNAAGKHYGPALFEIGRMHMEGTDLPHDSHKGLRMIRDAAVLGAVQAQFFLGSLYESGNGVPVDLAGARRYFRLCAAARQPACQYRLAQLLLRSPERPEREYVQTIAWLQLAREGGVSQASTILDQELPKLTPEQMAWIAGLKPQLIAADN